MNKSARKLAIKQIIERKTITSQDELRLELRKRSIEVTQATLSRDLSELGVSWVADGQGGRYVFPAASESVLLRPIVAAEILSIAANETMIVVRTLPGCASAVGEFVDIQRNPDIIGTLAGDNTLLVIPVSGRKTKSIVAFLTQRLTEGH
jgi:transcriptional regulator of arginine metabolism